MIVEPLRNNWRSTRRRRRRYLGGRRWLHTRDVLPPGVLIPLPHRGVPEVRRMTSFLLASLFPESIFLVEGLGSLAVIIIVNKYVVSMYQPTEGKADKPRMPEPRLAYLAVLGFPLLGLLMACLIL